MIFPVRPHWLFDKVQEPRAAVVDIPRRGPGSLTLLETFTLLAVCRVVQPQRIFEFGTFRGYTTLNLARNTEAEVLTLDLDQELARPLLEGEPRVQTLRGHSCRFDFSRWSESVDLVFIDGGHDAPTVQNDSEKALAMLGKDRTGAVVWHDYANKAYPELGQYLESLALPLYHVAETQICVYFNRDDI